MHTRKIGRTLAAVVAIGSVACAPAETAERDTLTSAASGAEQRAPDSTTATPPRDTVAPRSPATDSVRPTSPAPTTIRTAPGGTSGSIRARDTLQERRGYDQVIVPDFSDPSKRLPPAKPETGTGKTPQE